VAFTAILFVFKLYLPGGNVRGGYAPPFLRLCVSLQETFDGEKLKQVIISVPNWKFIASTSGVQISDVMSPWRVNTLLSFVHTFVCLTKSPWHLPKLVLH
jgi:hypothetical protein